MEVFIAQEEENKLDLQSEEAISNSEDFEVEKVQQKMESEAHL